jgi:hypothetical protein
MTSTLLPDCTIKPPAAEADDLSMDSRLERLLCFVARLSARGGTKIRF